MIHIRYSPHYSHEGIFLSFSSYFFCEIRLRQDSQLLQSRSINWSSSQEFQMQNLNGSTNSISSSSCNNIRECSESNSSTETLKWLGSMSDVSVASQATNTSTLSGKSISQHINYFFFIEGWWLDVIKVISEFSFCGWTFWKENSFYDGLS